MTLHSSGTRLFALLGDPVGHSLSPVFQNAGFRAAGLDAVYVALRVTALDLPALMQMLTDNGGGGNITIPHKAVAALPGALRSPRVDQLGVANVFGTSEGRLSLDNTDVDGVLAAIDRFDDVGNDWCVLGTGGSARAVVGAARERGARVAVRSRSDSRAADFALWAESIGVPRAEEPACGLIVNTTPLGLDNSAELPARPSEFPSAVAALDLTYRAHGTTPWCEAFRRTGVRTSDGREVLLHQGVASWRLWYPRVTPPIEVMRAALNGYMA